jgi:two-component system, cell cycle response regulator
MRVLVADDEPSTRLAVKAAVERLGHVCLVARDGAQAWNFLQSGSIDVFITDWLMPGLDGPELCRRIRAGATGSYTYTIIATALTGRADIVEGMRAGADDFLIKPIDPFAVETRLIAAERVTALHDRIRQHQGRLEQVNGELADEARTDPLTKLGNRRRLEEDVRALHSGAQRHDRPYSIAMCDLDHFKAYNDTYGHPCGDDALRRVAEVLADGTRAGDTAYRFGGEEFILLLADERLDGAVIAVERFRTSIEALSIPHAGNVPPGVLTISAGVAAYEPSLADASTVILDRADRALYVAKESGRNRVASLGADLVSTK